jgi:hypothetical protein
MPPARYPRPHRHPTKETREIVGLLEQERHPLKYGEGRIRAHEAIQELHARPSTSYYAAVELAALMPISPSLVGLGDQDSDWLLEQG